MTIGVGELGASPLGSGSSGSAAPGSVLEAIESGVVAQLLTITGVVAAKPVPIAEQFRIGTADDKFEAERPDGYPGFTVSLNDDEIEVIEISQRFGAATAIYRVPVYCALFVTTTGLAADVRKLAWQYGEATQKTLMLYAPSYPGVTIWPLEPSSVQPIIIDANTYGQLMKVWAKYQINVTA